MVSWFQTKFPKNDILLNDILLNDILLNVKNFVEEVLNEHEIIIKPALNYAGIEIGDQ